MLDNSLTTKAASDFINMEALTKESLIRMANTFSKIRSVHRQLVRNPTCFL